MRQAAARSLAALTCLIMAACGSPQPLMTELPTTSTQIPTPTSTPAPPILWIQPGVPAAMASAVARALAQAGYVQAETPDAAVVRIVLDPDPEAALTAQWVYAVAAPFPTVSDGVSWQDLQSYWQGSATTLPGFDTPPTIIVTQDVADLLAARFGPAGASVPLTGVSTDQAAQVVDMAWNVRPSISIVPFDQLGPRWKVLTVDGQSPLDKSLDVDTYPLTVTVGVLGDGEAGAQVVSLLQSGGAWRSTNRDPSRLTTVVLTGVTALTRATAYMMEVRGVNFPAEQILPFFADADILHTSNEVSFTPRCPPPEMTGEEKFCSAPGYFDLLKNIGLDVVELTGNHNNDYGTNADLYSLDLYDENGITYYGGGRDLADASTPRILTVPDGTRIAFVGCNSAGPYKAWATSATPGAAPCGDWSGIRQTIADLKGMHEAEIVIVTVQYNELPQYAPSDQQRADFEALATAGADIVSGSQAHQPMGFSFAGGGFIHFGVGNLFFDQMDYVENRQMFADKYAFYQGRLLSVVLFTGMMEDYAQPRPMTPEERADFLKLIFGASGW